MKASGWGWCDGRRLGASSIFASESLHEYPSVGIDRGRHSGFARREGFAGGPGNLTVSLAVAEVYHGVSGLADRQEKRERTRDREATRGAQRGVQQREQPAGAQMIAYSFNEGWRSWQME